MPKPANKRRTNPERSAETRGRLLDAAEQCLIELGYANTTNLEVCRRAGLSNGALLHHFHTRENLLASTLERLYERLKRGVIREVERLRPGSDRLDHLIDRLWSVFDSDEFKVVLELWLAAANDEALRTRVFPVMTDFSQSIGPTAASLLPHRKIDDSRFSSIVGLMMYVVQGMGLSRATFGSKEVCDPPQVRTLMKELARIALEGNSQPGGYQETGARQE